MFRLTSSGRIVLGLVSLTVSVVLGAGVFGLIPNPRIQEYQARRSFCESTAVTFMSLATRSDIDGIRSALDQLRERTPGVLSIGVRQSNGELSVESGSHQQFWKSEWTQKPGENQFIVPIMADGREWGHLEILWSESTLWRWQGIFFRPDVVLTLFVAAALSVVFSVYLRKVLKHVSPSKVVPPRVREALNALAEGLLVLDKRQCIVLANDSFATAAGCTPEELIGSHPDRFSFRVASDSEEAELPWVTTARSSHPVKGMLLTRGDGECQRTFSVSTVPVYDDKHENRGVVASFEDVTQLQKKQQELRDALFSLKTSSEEIRKQNRELEWLATRDTLTGCLNRRSFFRDFESIWHESREQNQSLSCMMVDIDHFKAINDNHGHSTGDEVLRIVSATVMKTVAETDLVCRYGGEEFSVLMPATSIDEAEMKAERCRLAIKALQFPQLKVTASLGVSAVCQGPDSPQDMLDQADKCLYVAKRNGRNQVVRWDRAQEQVAKLADEKAPTREEEKEKKAASAIPYHAVTALTSALSHRDQATALHSRRVADMCVATGEGLLSMRECYVLEIAALLHDIGKIGIPDSILKKPGRLAPAELEVVHQYNRMGVEMVQSSFGSPALTEIVEQHVVHFDMSNADRGAGPNTKPSVSARILAIANAYDTMVSPMSYRNQMSRAQAFAELRRCSGTQFDPELVERFIGSLRARQHHHPEFGSSVTKESALSIGLLLEQLVAALDDQDTRQLEDLANSLQITATTHGLMDIARLAQMLRHTLEEEHDQIDVMQIAGELLDHCRSTQTSLLEAAQTTV
ncbi:MAG: diguanylate cyclase [Planctomycetaceae bacterium]|nr:diguanylate cyclase [Planctomycetaceae bacterium]